MTTNLVMNNHDEETEIVTDGEFGSELSFLNPDEMPDLEAAEAGINIQPESIEFREPGESLRAIFNGFTFFKVKDKINKGEYIEKKTAVLQTKEGIKINMGANLLRQLELIPTGTALQITYKGLERTNSGNDVKVYEVKLLNVPRVNLSTSAPQPKPQLAPRSNGSAGQRVWSIAQRQVLIEEKLADNDFAAKGMLGLSNLSEDATEAEIVAWGKVYRNWRTKHNEDTGKQFTAHEAAEMANAPY